MDSPNAIFECEQLHDGPHEPTWTCTCWTHQRTGGRGTFHPSTSAAHTTHSMGPTPPDEPPEEGHQESFPSHSDKVGLVLVASFDHHNTHTPASRLLPCSSGPTPKPLHHTVFHPSTSSPPRANPLSSGGSNPPPILLLPTASFSHPPCLQGGTPRALLPAQADKAGAQAPPALNRWRGGAFLLTSFSSLSYSSPPISRPAHPTRGIWPASVSQRSPAAPRPLGSSERPSPSTSARSTPLLPPFPHRGSRGGESRANSLRQKLNGRHDLSHATPVENTVFWCGFIAREARCFPPGRWFFI